MPSPSLTPPQQPRSRKTLERLVAAGLAILEEEGPAGVTVQAVVARARSSVGSFYARFRGKDDLLAYLREQVRDSALSEWHDALESAPLSAVSLRELAGGVVDHLIDVRTRWHSSLKSAAGLPSGEADYDAFRRRVVEELAARLLERRSEIGHPSPERAVRVGLWAVLGVLDHEGSGETETDLDDEALRQECVGLLVAYLGGDRGRAAAPVEFFDVWS